MMHCSCFWSFAYIYFLLLFGSFLIVPGIADPCYICGDPVCTLDNPDAVITLPSPSPIPEATCGEIMTYGLDEIIPSDLCAMTESLREMCGCNCPSTNPPPPTTTPVVPTNPRPSPTTSTVAPVPNPTPRPTDPPVVDSVLVTFVPTVRTTDDDILEPGQAVLGSETNNPSMDSSTKNYTDSFNSTNVPSPTYFPSPSTVAPTYNSPSLRTTTQAPSLYSTIRNDTTMSPTPFNHTEAPSTRFPDNTFFPTPSSASKPLATSRKGFFIIILGTFCAISIIS